MELKQAGQFGAGFARPESVVCTKFGDVFTSDGKGVVTHGTADGRLTAIGVRPQGVDFISNGLCLIEDGSILVASVGRDGGVWRLWPDQTVTPFLMEAEGWPLSPANFVSADALGRYWISVSTRSPQRDDPFNRGVADGFLALLQGGKARIVADGLHFTNETRLSSDGRLLYVNETAARRLTRYRVRENGDLFDRAVVAEFAPGSLPDGCEIDAEGHVWICCVISNSLIRVSPDGRQEVLLRDTTDAYLERVGHALARGTFDRRYFYDDAGRNLSAITSLAFGGSDLRTLYLGSLVMTSLATFRSPVAGRTPLHWGYRRQLPFS